MRTDSARCGKPMRSFCLLNFQFKTASEFVKDLVECLTDLISTAEEAVLLASGEVAAVSIGRIGMN